MRSQLIVDTVTGDVLRKVRAASNSWGLRMNAQIGTGQMTVPLAAEEFKNITADDWQDLTRPWARTIVDCWNGVPFYSGVIGSSRYNYRSKMLTVGHAEPGALLKRRLFFGAGTYSKTAKLAWSGLSRQGVLVEAARVAVGGGHGAPVEGLYPWRLPVFLPSVIAGTRSVETFQHMFERPWDWMGEIPEEINGEDFVFAPGFNTVDGKHQWVMQVGTPLLNLSSVEFHLDAPESPVTNVDLAVDGDEQLTGVFATGEGMDEDIPVGFATPAAGGVLTPAMDSSVAFQKVTSQSKLNGLAAGLLDNLLSPPHVWSFSLLASAALRPVGSGGVRPGSRVRLNYAADPFLGSGAVDLYVRGMDDAGRGRVSVEVQTL